MLFVSRRTRGAAVGQWEAAYYKLESGYYRLVLEAKAGSAAESMNVAVDDLDIGPCGLSELHTVTSNQHGVNVATLSSTIRPTLC